jgi:hypothetical protein
MLGNVSTAQQFWRVLFVVDPVAFIRILATVSSPYYTQNTVCLHYKNQRYDTNVLKLPVIFVRF